MHFLSTVPQGQAREDGQSSEPSSVLGIDQCIVSHTLAGAGWHTFFWPKAHRYPLPEPSSTPGYSSAGPALSHGKQCRGQKRPASRLAYACPAFRLCSNFGTRAPWLIVRRIGQRNLSRRLACSCLSLGPVSARRARDLVPPADLGDADSGVAQDLDNCTVGVYLPCCQVRPVSCFSQVASSGWCPAAKKAKASSTRFMLLASCIPVLMPPARRLNPPFATCSVLARERPA
jgi:hypothetical protein